MIFANNFPRLRFERQATSVAACCGLTSGLSSPRYERPTPARSLSSHLIRGRSRWQTSYSTTPSHPQQLPTLLLLLMRSSNLFLFFQQLDHFWLHSAEVRLQNWSLRAHTQTHKNPTQTESQERIRSRDMPRCLMATLATTKERGEDGGGRHERGVWIPWPLES